MKSSEQFSREPLCKADKLPNGLQVVTNYMPNMHSVAVGVWVKCGLRHEPLRLNGVSHFVEHLVFKGTKNRSDHEISQSIEGVGGILNASTGDEVTFFYSLVPRERFRLALEVLLDIAMNPQFRAEYLERQRSIVLEEIHMYEDRPASVVQDLINAVLWDKHPLGRRILGTEKTIQSMTREDIVKYHKTRYVAPNCVVSVAGAPTHEEVVAEVRKHARTIRSSGRQDFLRVKNGKTGPRLLIQQKETEQCHFCLAVKTFHREHPDRFALKLLSTLLGENMSSRLFREVREKRGLAYSIHTDIDRYLDTGAFVISAGVVTDRAKEAVTTVLREMSRLKTKPVSKRELGRAREYTVGQIEMGMDRVMSLMMWAGENLLLSGKTVSPEETIRNFRAVTSEDIQRIANQFFLEDRLNLAVVGPIEGEKETLKWLKL
jgi:predicted Zn-dependent peptidase